MFPILALLLQAAPAPPPPPAPAPWTVTTRPSRDPSITSTVTGVASQDGNARLTLRCDAGKVKVVSVQVFTRLPLGGPPDRVVDLSVDGLTPISEIWEFAALPQSGAYNRADQAVTTMTTAMATAKSIKLHTITFAGEPVDATFAGPPSDASIKAVLAACDYTLGTVPVRETPKK